MRIQLASDLHLEFLQRDFLGARVIAPAADADVLVLAGDIANGADAVDLFADWPVPVIYLAGNHEFYGNDFDATRLAIKAAAGASRDIHFLDNSGFVFDGVRFLGATLWTNYRLMLNKTQRQLMDIAEQGLNDHRVIRTGARIFSAARALAEHDYSRAWLAKQLALPFDGITVVVTHHGPHPMSIHPRYAGDPINAAFVSDLSPLLDLAPYWIHGHVHDSFDYRVGGCRVVANPRGYALNRRDVAFASQLEFENARFNGACVIEV
jgi:predicted phosphodiesterase